MAIRHPMLNRRFGATRAVHGVVIGSAWLLSAVYSLPWLVAYDIVAYDIVTTGTAVFCTNTLPLNTRVYAMVNFFVLYVVPLVFMSFVYVRISITLWRSSTIQSLPIISLHLLQHGNHQNQQQNEESSPHHLRSRSTSTARLFASSSYPNSPCLSVKSPLHGDYRRSQMNDVDATAAAERHVLAPPGSTGRRPTNSYTTDSTRTINERRSTQLTVDHNPLTSRRKVVRLLAAVVTSFALCMLPHHVRVQWQEWRTSSYSYEEMYIPPITTLIFYINSCLNPLLYALISDKFRQAFADLRCRRHTGTVPPPLLPVAPLPAHDRFMVRCNSQPNCSRTVNVFTNRGQMGS